MNNEQVQEIFVEDIIPNRFQPRLTFDEKALKELSDSIKNHGIIQPLVLRKIGNKYEIIAGERRYKASCMAGLTKVPAIVREMTDNESAEVALIENIQRKNLTSIEEAQSYRNLLNKGYLTQEELAKKLGVTQPTIANKLRLLNLPDEVQNALLNGKISERHARSLLQISSEEEQNKMLNRIVTERLTVKQLDVEIKKLLSGEKPEDTVENKVDTTPKESDKVIMNQNTVIENKPEIIEQEIKPRTNMFGMKLEPPTDLEQTAPNLNSGIVESVPPMSFNPFNKPTNNEKTEEIETFDIFGDTIKVNNEVNNTENSNPVKEKNIGDEITTIRDTVKSVEANGFIVEMEEYDFEDMYQIIIKIKK